MFGLEVASECVYGAGGHLPSVTIEYRDVEVEADALVGSDSIPSLINAFWHALKVRTFSVCCQAFLGEADGQHDLNPG
jgi:hypothetical protein